jgi:hypothetical protein
VNIYKERVWIHKNEVVDVVQIEKDGRIRYYSYTYKVKGNKGQWRPAVRWDNLEQTPHVDKFDENSALIEQKPCRDKNLNEIVKLVGIYRKNLMAMDVSQL